MMTPAGDTSPGSPRKSHGGKPKKTQNNNNVSKYSGHSNDHKDYASSDLEVKDDSERKDESRDESIDERRRKHSKRERSENDSERSTRRRRRTSRENYDYDDRSDERERYYSDTKHRSEYSSRKSSTGNHSSYRYNGSASSHRERSSTKDRDYYKDVTPIHLMKSKLNNWDVPPPEYPRISAKRLKASGLLVQRDEADEVEELPQSSAKQRHHSRIDNKYIFENSHHTHNALNNSHKNVSSTQALNISRQAMRLYVGNIPYDITGDALVEFLNSTMVRLNLAKKDSYPVILAQINHDKSFAFVEFKTPEDATTAIALDNIILSGQSLKIRRPKDYQPPPMAISQIPTLSIPNSFNTNVRENNERIFIKNIPSMLDEDQVKELLKPFGELKSFNLIRDTSIHGGTKSFAFCEFVDPSVTDSACKALNGMEIGDNRIVVQRANSWSGPRSHNNSYSMSQTPSVMSSSITNSAPMSPSSSIFSFTIPFSAPSIPSPTLILMNMFTYDDILDEKVYKEIIDDICLECEKFGEVLNIYVPQSQDPSNAPVLAKVYVEFANKEISTKALNSLAGRTFMERTVIATYCNHPVPQG